MAAGHIFQTTIFFKIIRWLPVFCFNGPHLDTGYDISLFRAGLGKDRIFLCFLTVVKKKKKKKQAASKKEAGGGR